MLFHHHHHHFLTERTPTTHRRQDENLFDKLAIARAIRGLFALGGGKTKTSGGVPDADAMAIGDLKTRLRAKFTRRYSTASDLSIESANEQGASAGPLSLSSIGKKTRSIKSRASLRAPSVRSLFGGAKEKGSEAVAVAVEDFGTTARRESVAGAGAGAQSLERDTGAPQTGTAQGSSDRRESASEPEERTSTSPSSKPPTTTDTNTHDSSSTADFPTPNTDIAPVIEEEEHGPDVTEDQNIKVQFTQPDFVNSSATQVRPAELLRRQSILPAQQTRLIKTLLETELPGSSKAATLDYFIGNGPSTISPNMVSRKIWVKRPGASATLVVINEDDLVDDVRDMILKKYANSLGRNFDAPDVTLRIITREQRAERILGPEEPIARTLDAYFPGGQNVDEALVIDVPVRRTPKPSPRPQTSYYDRERDESRPTEAGTEYFPPMPVPAAHSPHISGIPPHVNGHHPAMPAHSMSVINTGQVPALPSPGGTGSRRHLGHRRPAIGRTTTSSPTANNVQAPLAQNGTQIYTRSARSRTHSSASEKSNAPPTAPPLPTPPPQALTDIASQIQRVATPPPRVSSPRPTARVKKNKKNADHPSLPAGMLNGAVPPINVLIVEDNIINLKLLEAFMKRLKVRWQTAMNGREAVTKWRAGGFHLVLMDIQLPIMSGLEATKEIRRLERLNSIGVFSSSASSSAPDHENETAEPEGEDKLPSTVLFKSPVIIVALTASSLQSDRHEALAAGCNDFLTKVCLYLCIQQGVQEFGSRVGI